MIWLVLLSFASIAQTELCSGSLSDNIFTDGDLRRVLDSDVDIKSAAISKVMVKGCKTVSTGMLAAESLRIMEQNKISSLVVVDDQKNIVGIIHLSMLLKAGLI